MPQHLEEVAARLAVDGAFRERCRQRLQAAVSVGSGSGDKGDVLGRVRRLNEYLATGFVLDDEGAAGSSTPALLRLEQQRLQMAPPVQRRSSAGAPASEGSVSDSDSDIEDRPSTVAGGAGDLAGLLAAAQAAVERRKQHAALHIQSAFRRHVAQQLVRRLEEARRRQAAERLFARLLAGASARVCGQQRCLAREGAAASLRRWRRCHWRAKLRHKRRAQRQRGAQEAAAKTEAEVGVVQQKHQQQDQQHQQQGRLQERQGGRATPPGRAPSVKEVQQADKPQDVRARSSRSTRGSSSSLPAFTAGVTPAPLLDTAQAAPAQLLEPAPAPPQLPAVSALAEQVSTPVAASLPHSPTMRHSTCASGSSPAQHGQQQTAAQGCLQQCLAPPPRTAQAAWLCQPDRPSPPRTATLSSRSSGSWESPPHSAGRSRHDDMSDNSCCLAVNSRTCSSRPASSARGQGHGTYRRLSSIQLLESVQLGIDGIEGLVASQAAVEVCERVAERVAGLQRLASGSAARRTISRAGSTAQRQASRGSGWAAEAIDE